MCLGMTKNSVRRTPIYIRLRTLASWWTSHFLAELHLLPSGLVGESGTVLHKIHVDSLTCETGTSLRV
mgnify:CR=1 FL=1